jgi:hypothetical protein
MLNALIIQFARNIFGKTNMQISKYLSKHATHVNACGTETQKPIRVGRTPDFGKFQAVHADHFGELNVPNANHPFRYVLVLCDHRTMWTELLP